MVLVCNVPFIFSTEGFVGPLAVSGAGDLPNEPLPLGAGRGNFPDMPFPLDGGGSIDSSSGVTAATTVTKRYFVSALLPDKS